MPNLAPWVVRWLARSFTMHRPLEARHTTLVSLTLAQMSIERDTYGLSVQLSETARTSLL